MNTKSKPAEYEYFILRKDISDGHRALGVGCCITFKPTYKEALEFVMCNGLRAHVDIIKQRTL